ncbi:hypothetical protein L249_8062 [Ophiocordyceps polyrhachis-furcata BCC 54312]|uniref:Uncharacterized protein n=1 Tax=Ophiocordyceps polyrhachis-furcata BCC 54312 TaxID=1330021 RepID=A0A367LHF4_9HYPO|nr:hypothetical protein L249_8062 [Ophiocordyceps polyrhachis-furcata BCC 54312]
MMIMIMIMIMMMINDDDAPTKSRPTRRQFAEKVINKRQTAARLKMKTGDDDINTLETTYYLCSEPEPAEISDETSS